MRARFTPFRRCPMKVLDLVQSRHEIFSIQEDATIHEAARYLRDHQVRSVGVMDAAGRLAGVVSHSDISNKVAAENKCPAWMRVSEIMSRGLVVVRPEMALDECLRLMEKHGVFGCATRNGQSCPAGLPIVVEFTAMTAATDGDDRVGAANGPEHSGAFEPGADEGFAARFDHSGTHEQSLLTELRVTYASGVALEIVGLGLDLLCQFLSFCGPGAQAIHQ